MIDLQMKMEIDHGHPGTSHNSFRPYAFVEMSKKHRFFSFSTIDILWPLKYQEFQWVAEGGAMVRPNHVAADVHSEAAETLISRHVHQDILNHTWYMVGILRSLLGRGQIILAICVAKSVVKAK